MTSEAPSAVVSHLCSPYELYIHGPEQYLYLLFFGCRKYILLNKVGTCKKIILTAIIRLLELTIILNSVKH